LSRSRLVQIAFASGNRGRLSGWGWTLASGIIDVAIGIFLMAFPGVTPATLPFFLGFWLMFRAFYLMGMAFDLNHAGVKGWGWLLTMGIFTLIFAWLVLYFPLAGAVSIVYYSALAFIAAGLGAFVLALKLRGAGKNVEQIKKDLKGGLGLSDALPGEVSGTSLGCLLLPPGVLSGNKFNLSRQIEKSIKTLIPLRYSSDPPEKTKTPDFKIVLLRQ
jgi:hypothetical protein